MGFENAKDIIACGFDPEKTFIFSHRDYCKEVCVIDLANESWKHINVNHVQKIFGLPNNCTIGMINWPIYQSIAAFSKYYTNIFGATSNYRCLVAYAIDQDPYFRLCRELAPKMKLYKPCSIMCTFLPALSGNEKMSTTGSSPTIFMKDTKKEIMDKVKKYAVSGGQETKELHQKIGGNLDLDISYQYLRYFEPKDQILEKVGEEYSSGKMLTSEIKKIMGETVAKFILDHQKKRSQVTDNMVKKFYDLKKFSQKKND